MRIVRPADRHLALFVDSLYGAGVQRTMLQLASRFVACGYRVDLVVCEHRGQFVGRIPEDVHLVVLERGSRFRPLLRAMDRPCPPRLWWPLLRFGRARRLEAFVAYLRERRPHALLAAGTPPNLLAIAGRRLAGVETRIVISQHTTLSAKVARRSQRWKLPLARALYPQADAIVGVSHGVGRDLSRIASIPDDRIEVVYNPVVGPALLEAARAPAEHPWLREDGPPVVLAVGRLKPRKDYESLIRAFARLREHESARLLILGEGGERGRLERLVAELSLSDCVDLPGFSDNPFASMARAALFVHTARWEGLGNVLIEALACGCPVVSTDCPSGPSEILDGGKYGALVPVGDVRALADAMHDTLEQPLPADALRSRGAMFDIDAAVDRYLSVLLPVGRRLLG